MPSELEGFIFPYFFAENRILGCLGGILAASWAALANFWAVLGPQDASKMRYLGPKTAPRRDQDLPKSGPKHLPRRTWQPKTAKNLKNLENDPQKSMGYPSGPRFWSLHGYIWDHFGEDFGTLLAPHFGSMLTSIFYIFE